MKSSHIPGIVTATVFGAGFSPFAPGTAGSLVCAVLFYFTRSSGVSCWIALAAILPISYWGCRVGQRLWGDDPSRVVVDEFAGCWIACLLVPETWGIAGIAAAFTLFRIMDILKPWPVSIFDRMKNPSGILLDDVAAGILAGVIIRGGAMIHGMF